MANIRAIYRRPLGLLDNLGGELSFYLRALAWTPRTVKRYKKETMRLLAEVVEGPQRLAVDVLDLPHADLDAVGGREERHHCPFGGTSWK